MVRLLGYGAIVAALMLSVWGVVAAVVGARTRQASWVRSAERAAFVNLALLLLSNSLMVYALVTHDFSISYVAQVGSRSTPLFFTIISLWSSLEGSILFWGLVLAGYSAAAVWAYRHKLPEIMPYVTATLLGVSTFFYLLLVGPASPWGAVFPVPFDGPGPNPLLQNHILMAVHPPFLYLGYVGMTVPFAFAVGALVTGRLGEEWIKASRRWTLFAWAFLSIAIIMGMWWSYEVLGWGGYWAWDPVENASFLPWLTATAYLHSAMVQERRGLLKTWNLGLIVATFVLTVLGTFLTRSGILSSVHAFSEGPIGYWFLGFITLVLIFSAVLLAGRSSELRATGRLDSVVSREAAFLVNNLLFTAFTFTVLLGTLFPLVAEAARGIKVSVGAPFFNKMTVPLSIALLLLVGVGPLLPWRRGKSETLRSRMMVPAATLLAVLVAAVALGERRPVVLLALGMVGFSLVANLAEFWRGAAARVRAHGETPPAALFRLINANRRRYGGYIAHVGTVLLALGIVGSSSYRQEAERTLAPGESIVVGDVAISYDELWAKEEPQRFVVGATVTAREGEKTIGVLEPRLNFYRTQSEPVPTPDVKSGLAGDVYVTLMAFERDASSITLHAYLEPLVGWIWWGGILAFVGALVAAWPARRRRRGPAGAEPRTDAEGWDEPALAASGGAQ